MKNWITSVAVIFLSLQCAAWAQTAEQLDAVMKAMPQPAQQVIDRLGELNRLPDADWRVHPGDLPHGESVDVDDSSWAVAKRGTDYPSGAVWFRQWLEVPKSLHGYDLTGAKIWFSFQSRTRAATESARSSISTAAAWRWARAWKKSSFSITQSLATAC